MKLLFDQNLSAKLCNSVSEFFPHSTHVKIVGLERATDREIWNYARANGYAIVSQDADFAEMAVLLKPLPKVVWLRTGNQFTSAIVDLLTLHASAISAFADDEEMACFEIYG